MFVPKGEYEWNFVMQMLANRGATASVYWIGIMRETGMPFTDVSGTRQEDLTFTIWDTALMPTGNQNYGTISYSEFGNKHMSAKSNADDLRPYICQLEGEIDTSSMCLLTLQRG